MAVSEHRLGLGQYAVADPRLETSPLDHIDRAAEAIDQWACFNFSTSWKICCVARICLVLLSNQPVNFFTLSSIRMTSVALAIVSLHNAVLLQSLTGPA